MLNRNILVTSACVFSFFVMFGSVCFLFDYVYTGSPPKLDYFEKSKHGYYLVSNFLIPGSIRVLIFRNNPILVAFHCTLSDRITKHDFTRVDEDGSFSASYY